jgi:hypothetical protein
MKPEELRIGNRLDYFINEDGIEWAETIIDWQDFQWIATFESDFNKKHRPIPLTEEWLIKFGWKSIGDLHPTFKIRNYLLEENMLREGKYYLRQVINKEDSLAISPEILYVHQFQNLYFALTGQELTIKEK